MRTAACPEPGAYEKLHRNELPVEDVEALAAHLEDCAYCAGVVQSLSSSDTPCDWLRGLAGTKDQGSESSAVD
jgi:hypothetical protein